MQIVENTSGFYPNAPIFPDTCSKIEPGVFYYTSDHLGSSTVITDSNGDYYEHTEYFPYGEVWVNERSSVENHDMPYKYTAKEYDPETKLTYYGERYYDAKLSRWISVDPPLISGEYLPQPGNKDQDANLPGMGGVFNPINLDAYQYGGMNPVKYVDPDGNEICLATGATYGLNRRASNEKYKLDDIIVGHRSWLDRSSVKWFFTGDTGYSWVGKLTRVTDKIREQYNLDKNHGNLAVIDFNDNYVGDFYEMAKDDKKMEITYAGISFALDIATDVLTVTKVAKAGKGGAALLNAAFGLSKDDVLKIKNFENGKSKMDTLLDCLPGVGTVRGGLKLEKTINNSSIINENLLENAR